MRVHSLLLLLPAEEAKAWHPRGTSRDARDKSKAVRRMPLLLLCVTRIVLDDQNSNIFDCCFLFRIQCCCVEYAVVLLSWDVAVMVVDDGLAPFF